LVFGILIPVIINQLYKSNTGYITLWGAADVLVYYGSFSAAVGSIVLGTIAWKQNERLAKIEENDFVAKNACMGFIYNIVIYGVKQRVCNLELYDEQIATSLEQDKTQEDYSSFSIEIGMKMKDHVATLVRIKSILLIVSELKSSKTEIIQCENNDEKFSRVAISNEEIKFNVTMLIKDTEKRNFLRFLNNQNNKITISMVFILLTDKYVSTELQCRSELVCQNYSDTEEIYNEFKVENDESPRCFWYGNKLLDKKMIEIKKPDKYM